MENRVTITSYIYNISLYIIFIDIYPFSNIATPRDVILEKKKRYKTPRNARRPSRYSSAIADLILRVLLGYPRDCVRLHLFITDISVDGDRKLRHFIDRTLRHQLADCSIASCLLEYKQPTSVQKDCFLQKGLILFSFLESI